MRIMKKTIAAAAAIAACLSTAAPVYAAVSTDIPQPAAVYDEQDTIVLEPLEFNEDAPRYSNLDAAAAYLKKQLKEHNTEFDFIVTGWSPIKENGEENDDIDDAINDRLVTLGSDPSEGLYLRLSAAVTSSYLYSSDRAYVKYKVEYYTTPEQEQFVNEEMAKLRESDGFREAKNLDIYHELMWAYDYVVSQMVLHDDIEDTNYCTAYSALANKKANESGQIHLLIRVLQELGIQPSLYGTLVPDPVNGMTVHMLCMVSIDGTFYFLDPVWDHKIGDNEHRFFLRGYSDLDSNNGGNEDYTHIHLFEIVGLDADTVFASSGVSKTAFPDPDSFSYKLGDVNGDGKVDAVDASKVLSEYARRSSSNPVKLFTENQLNVADVDANDHVDAVDASRILAYYAYAATTDNPMTIKEYLNN